MSFNKAKLFPLLSVFCIKNINQQARGKHGSQCSMKRATPAVAQLRKIRVKMLRLFKEVEQTMESGDCSSASDEPSLKGWKLKRQSLRLDSRKNHFRFYWLFLSLSDIWLFFGSLRISYDALWQSASQPHWKRSERKRKFMKNISFTFEGIFLLPFQLPLTAEALRGDFSVLSSHDVNETNR